MEIAIPLVALGSLYFISGKDSSTKEKFTNSDTRYDSSLPNYDVPNKNYPSEYPVGNVETELTSKLSNDNRYEGGAYTDKFFDPNQNKQYTNSYSSMEHRGKTTKDINTNNPSYDRAPYYSLTGKAVDSDYFKHDNMVPYFAGHVRSRTLNANSNESTLDNYVGAGSQTITKSEQSPMFSPGEHVQWAYGAPNMNDFYQSRVNPSLRMANVKPFEQETVAPGLGLGYTAEGSGGYNSGMAMREAWLDRGVDELRVANKPKTSFGMFGHEGPSYSAVTTRGELGIQNKNGQDTTFVLGHDRVFTTTGIEKAPTARAIPVERHVNRPETSVSYSGVAGAYNEQTYVPGEYMPSKHNDLGEVPIGVPSASGRLGGYEGDYEMRAKFAYPNNRSSNSQYPSNNDYFGTVGGAIGAVIAPLLDVLRPSRKENVIGNLRLYENAHAMSNYSSTYVYNPNDTPAPTIRETTQNNKYIPGVNSNQSGGAYQTLEFEPMVTERTTTTVSYMGNSSATERSREIRPYDAEYNQRNNDIKSSTIEGRMVPGSMALMNADINVRTRSDAMMKNNRDLVMTGGPRMMATTSQMGEINEKLSNYSTIGLDRSSPDTLDAFRHNPYTHSLPWTK